MSEDLGALCSPTVLFYAGVLAPVSVLILLIGLYGERKTLAWASAALSVASSLVLAVCFRGALGAA
jgi:hypothetical protein